MAEAHINIGSNIGDRHALIERAVAAIESALNTSARRAPVEETAPWGYESGNMFLNLGIACEVGDMAPEKLHAILQDIQHSIDSTPHRNADGTYADRAIDIDLIALGREVVDNSNLTLPHPRMHLRPFVLRPIAILSPEWVHPLTNQTAAGMLEVLKND